MARILEQLRILAADEQAPTAAEYAILAGSIAVVICAAVGALGISVRGLFLSLVDKYPR